MRAGLEGSLRDAVRSGRLAAGTRLPSSRSLAADLGLARNTVADAYGQLVAEGWLRATTGSGTYVNELRAPADAPADTPPRVDPRWRYDLRAGSPDLSLFPRKAWLSATRRVFATASDETWGYGDPRGRVELRNALTRYLGRARGVVTTPDCVVVTAGFTHSVALLCAVLLARGAGAVLTENYGLRSNARIISGSGLRHETVVVDDGGVDIESIRSSPDCGGLILTPTHQFPLGAPLDAQRRGLVVNWAVEGDRIVVEDDYDGEFRYDRQPVGALQALDPQHVVYAGTASKTLAPGMRLGWLAVPASMLDELVVAVEDSGRHPAALDQVILADLIESGLYDRHVRRCRLIYRTRRDTLSRALNRAAPHMHLSRIEAGLHARIELPPGASEDAIVDDAARRGLAVEALSEYRLAPPERGPALVVGYASPPQHAYSAAVARLMAVLADIEDR